jgi:hypothetical protein
MMLFRETNAVHCENNMNKTNILCRLNTEFYYVKKFWYLNKYICIKFTGL